MKLIKFEKENCPKCTLVENYLNDQGVQSEKVNPFENPSLASRYNVGSIPTTVLVDDIGEKIGDEVIGFNGDELDELISKLK